MRASAVWLWLCCSMVTAWSLDVRAQAAAVDAPPVETRGPDAEDETAPAEDSAPPDPKPDAAPWFARPWWAGTLAAASGAAVLAVLAPLIWVPPLICVLPLAGVPLAVAGALTAWGVAWALGRRVPVGGLLLSAVAAGGLAGVVATAFGAMGAFMLMAAVISSGTPSVQPWLVVGSAPMMAVAVLGFGVAVALWGVAAAVLAGPCARPLLPWESAWNLDLLGAPGAPQANPPWLTDLERRQRQPGWEEPVKKKGTKRRKVVPTRPAAGSREEE